MDEQHDNIDEDGRNLSGMSRDEVYKILDKMNVPYVKVDIFKDNQERIKSPIGTLCDTFECLVNSLLGDATIMGDDNAGVLLNYFYQCMKEQIIMSQLILKSRKGDEMPDALKDMLEGREGMGNYEGRGRKTPISNVWLDAFKDEEGKEEEEGREEEGKESNT